MPLSGEGHNNAPGVNYFVFPGPRSARPGRARVLRKSKSLFNREKVVHAIEVDMGDNTYACVNVSLRRTT